MTQYLYYVIFNTAAGWVGVLSSETGLLRITLPRRAASDAYQQLGDEIKQAAPAPDRFQDLMERLSFCFAGHRVDFPDKLDLSAATAFQREVWEATRLIPYGETRNYAWVAAQIKKPKAVRAVGQALGKNPLPVIIPCHRVLARDGGLGGFGGGLEMKKYLLRLESSTKIR
jgi:methylated-DNA-[protein]-cysteine S-methyltransferase